MTAHTIKDEIAFSCDTCAETVTPAAQDGFGAAWAEARADGWRATKIEWGKYEHACPDCARAEAGSPT